MILVPANDIALRTIGRPLANTTLIGAFAAATGELKLETLLKVAKERFTGKSAEGNIQAITEGHAYIQKKLKET
jgi:pyruvate ferredoxin oxidoreductase gamma subunit